MFCGECGAKNKKGAAFCEECGAKLETEEKETKKVEKKETKEKETETKEVKKVEKKPLTKKQKTLLIIGAVVLVVLFGGYKYLEKQTNPKTIVENYMKAVNAGDYKKLYKYSNYEGDKTFISEKQFEEAMKEKMKNVKAGNYVVGTPTYENGGLDAVVTVNTTEKKEVTIKLAKGSGKKYLFFDSWSITDSSSFGLDTLKQYKLRVPEGTKITFAGIDVKDSYKVKEDSSKDDDSNLKEYELPQVFAATTKVTFKFAGASKDVELTPSPSYSAYTIYFDEDDFSEKDTSKMLDASKKVTEAVMKGLIDGKEFKDIKEAKTLDEDTKELYDYKVKAYKRSNKSLTAFELKDAKVTNISTTDGYLRVTVRLNYKYSTTSIKDRNYTSTVYYTMNYDKDFEVIRMSSMPYTSTY